MKDMETNFHPVTLAINRKRKGAIWSLLIASVITGILLRVFVVDSFIVKGDSMAPTIQNGDYVFANKLSYINKEPKRGDVVVGHFRGLEEVMAIKRVVGLPGEWVFVEGGQVKVAKSKEAERQVIGQIDSESYTETVAEDYEYRLDPFEYFLMGDNGLGSVDSRDLGPVDVYSIEGKIIGAFRAKEFKFVSFQ